MGTDASNGEDELVRTIQAIDDYALYLGELIIEVEAMKFQCIRQQDLRGVMNYGTLIRDLSRHRDAIKSTHPNDLVIPPNVAKWLTKKLKKN